MMKRFTVTEQHLALIRQLSIRWSGGEYGNPEIDPKRPYGNSDRARDVLTILGLRDPRDRVELSPEEEALAWRLHREVATALEILLAVGTFTPGVYVAGDYSAAWGPEATS